MIVVAWLMLILAATLFSFVALLAPFGPCAMGVLGLTGILFFSFLSAALGRLEDDLRRH